MPSAIDIAREYLPGYSDNILDFMVWEFTGFPSFWRIPENGNSPEECFRKQLVDLAKKLAKVRVNKSL